MKRGERDSVHVAYVGKRGLGDREEPVRGVQFERDGYGFQATAKDLREAGSGSLERGVEIIRRRYARLNERQRHEMAKWRDMHWIYDMQDDDE